MSVAAIILAAGASSRLGQPKQLLKVHGEFLIDRAIRIAVECGAEPVFNVFGANFEVICASMRPSKSISVINEQWQQGMATSIHAGLRAMEAAVPHATGALLMGCDQPRLSAEHLRTLLATFETRDLPAIVCSSYGGIRGAPAVFPPTVFSQLRALRGDKGARSLLAQAPCPVIAKEFPGGETDIDLPSDLTYLE